MDEYLQLVLLLHSKHIHLREDVKKKSQFNQVTLQQSYKVETSQMSNKKKLFPQQNNMLANNRGCYISQHKSEDTQSVWLTDKRKE